MKSKSLLVVLSALLIVALAAAGCGGSKATTATSTTATVNNTTSTTNTQTTQTTQTNQTTQTTTSAAGPALPTTPDPITNVNHKTAAQMTALKGTCLLMCHGPGTSYQMPLPPSWDATKYGSTTHTGVFTVVPGSTQDHTGRTEDQCTQAGCHAAPTS